MANLSRSTRDHEVIRRWAEERGGKPAHVKSTGSGGDIGILRIDFPGYSGEGSLEPISWEQFFEKFDERNLALVYQEETAEGQKSNFNKLVSAESVTEDGGRAGRRGSRSRTASRPASKKGAKSSAGTKAAASTASARRGSATKKGVKAALKKSAAKKAAATRAPARGAAKKSSAKKTATARKSSAAKKASAKRRR